MGRRRTEDGGRVTTPGDAGLRARREAMIRRHIDAENRFDVEATLATMQDPPRYEVLPYRVKVEGREAVRAFLAQHFAAMPAIVTTARRFYHADDAVIVETHVEGEHAGEIEGIARNGRRFVVDGIGIFYFDPGDDRILGEKVVSDMLALVRQLGGDISPGVGR
jgi:steroid delta-isomerase-like uncharacterized protein